MPHRFSQTGPPLAIADIDKNGFEDFWIGGPAKYAGKLFMQQRNGTFLERDMPDADYEDAGGIFFDANGDGYPDLYVVSGGNEYDPGSERYQDRLYLNDGKGDFKRMEASLPQEHYSGSCVASNDFDKDGDLDLFVGGSIVPGNYPFASPSLFLQNNGNGTFDNVTRSICTELENAGLITTALWSDFDKDGWSDLVVSGEWTPLMFFKNNRGKLIWQIGNPELEKLTGWWFSLAGADFDKDGDTDYVAGNLGLNNKFNVSFRTPLSVYAKDFDGNGTTESILTYFLNGIEYPVAGRDDIAFVMPSIKKQFDNYTKFANADFPQIFSKDQLEGANIQKATCFGSVYIENKGNGKFAVRNLPLQAQLSAIQSFQLNDFDDDGIIDILAAGNFYSPDFMTGRYDASPGVLLKGDGAGNFIAIPGSQSGLSLKGDVRNTGLIKIKNKECLIVAVNSAMLQTYQINMKK